MNNPTDKPQDNMYEVVFPVPDVTGGEEHLTLVIALNGYADAGHAITESARFLLDALEHRPLVNFSIDELVDYRSRRPAVTMNHDEIVDVADLNLSLDVVRDNSGKPFLLLSGPEPDMRWEAFSAAVADLAERYNVGRTVSLYSAPMTVPHTRPLGIIAHGSDQRKLKDLHKWGNRVTVPGAASLNIEYELTRRGRDAFGFTAQVPHYVAASEYPLASLRLLQEVAKIAGLDLPLEALERESARVAEILNAQTNESGEVSQLVNLLEEQYDQEVRRRQALESSPLLGPDGEMPSGDELGAEFEKFLASQPLRPAKQESSSLDDEAGVATDAEPEVASDAEATAESGTAAEDNSEAELEQPDVSEDAADKQEASESDAKSDNEPEQKKPRRRGWKPWFRF
ncbi:MAG: PAC2 family protein [Corynebacterium sp.]|uniref:PAC2 family protein n=1 Tax=Corynebacterium sp. TaxID=1720 RepID=UPI0026DDBE86|nr:PAC2 family protein [Corynebacterium sp.]MDO5029201.1 PAC2 family protein [Corynebacterium sp.]